MKVYYRMCDIASTNPSPILQENKFKLNEMCLRSFVRAYRDVRPFVVFLCDYCPRSEYAKMIDEVCPFDKDIIFSEMGINGTAVEQFTRAEMDDDELILFQECDYFYREGIGKDMEDGIKELGLVSPYDHRNFYIDKAIHSDTVELQLINDVHWRSTERNTMTFGVRGDVFREHAHLFKHYGYLDDQIWYDLWMFGIKMFVPIPSFATHCVTDYLAPSVDWSYLWNSYL